jgi:hypothetical protein
MSSEPDIVVKPAPPKNLCPVCHKPSYSLSGIHPQCAIELADRPRILKLRAAKAVEVGAAKTKKRPTGKLKKRCPKCGLESHIMRKACSCGHKFPTR